MPRFDFDVKSIINVNHHSGRDNHLIMINVYKDVYWTLNSVEFLLNHNSKAGGKTSLGLELKR